MVVLLEIFAVSALLFAGYAWLLERRTDFRWCRCYLTLFPLLSVAIPLLEIPLWPGRVVTLQPIEPISGAAVVETAPVAASAFEWVDALWFVYGLGVLLLLGLMLYQVRKIRLLERGAEIDEWEGIRVVRTSTPIASFSFFRTVYLPATTPTAEAAVILRHEESHIRHHHSRERLWMELWKALLWWNPFVWLAARRLTEVEEFEADRDVLASGEDGNHYIQTIFKQLFGYSPDIANGLRDSLTKKRFQMMTQNKKSRYARLRMAATLSLVASLVVVFGTTARATQKKEVKASEPITQEQPMLTVEKMPSFQGGSLSEFKVWVTENLKYPQEAVKKKIAGRVLVQFVINEEGEVVDAKALQSPHALLSNEALRVVSSSPRWEPGVQKGEKVAVRFVLPVDFAL